MNNSIKKKQDFEKLLKLLNNYEKNKILNKYGMFQGGVFILNSTQRNTMYKEMKDMENKGMFKYRF